MQTTRTQTLKIAELQFNDAQPEKRHEQVRELKQSIETYGLFYEPIVSRHNDTYVIVDGHRRIEACKQLGIEEISCKVIQRDDISPTEAFGIVNKDVKRLSSKDFMRGYAAGGIVPADLMRMIIHMTDRHGKKIITLANRLNISMRSVQRYSALAERIGIKRGNEFCDFVQWVIKYKLHSIVVLIYNQAIESQYKSLVGKFRQGKIYEWDLAEQKTIN